MKDLILTLERLKAEIEWDFSMEYQVALDKVLKLLRHIDGQSETKKQ